MTKLYQRVAITENNGYTKHKGTVVGTCTEMRTNGVMMPHWLVSLDEGFYDPTGTIFVRLMVVHSDNIRELKE
jgi:hypothetical protein